MAFLFFHFPFLVFSPPCTSLFVSVPLFLFAVLIGARFFFSRLISFSVSLFVFSLPRGDEEDDGAVEAEVERGGLEQSWPRCVQFFVRKCVSMLRSKNCVQTKIVYCNCNALHNYVDDCSCNCNAFNNSGIN